MRRDSIVKLMKWSCLEVCPFLSRPSPLFSAVPIPLLCPLGSLLACVPTATTSAATLGLAAGVRALSATLLSRGCQVCPWFSKALRILIISVTSACQFWLTWAGRRKHGWMQGQHNCLNPAFSREQTELFDTGGELAALCNFMSLPAPEGSETRRQYKTPRRWVCPAFKCVHWQCCRVLAGPADFFSRAYYQISPEEQ